MTAYSSRLSGEEWQRWANQILKLHYGPTEYQTVPDNDKGDAGIEGFTISDGRAFQAYGCEEPISTKQRFTAQRDKMSTDIKKFIDNKEKLTKIFGSVLIKRWVLFVPHCDSKDLVSHSTKKTQEVLAANLPYVTNDFYVMVCEESDYPLEVNQLLNSGIKKVSLEVDKSTSDQVDNWASTNHSLTAILEKKILKIPTITNSQHRQEFNRYILSWFLEGQSIHEALRTYPEIYEAVIKIKTQRENFLAMSLISSETPANKLDAQINILKDTFSKEVAMLDSLNAEALAFEAVADWLLRCPLDFPELI